MKRAAVFLLLAGCAAEPPAPPGLPPGTVAGTVTIQNIPLSDAFVYVKQGLEGRRFDVPSTPALLDQKNNEFVPRVLGLRAGQPLRILSSDYGIHNVFCNPFQNSGFNETLQHEQSTTKVFQKSEAMVQLKCNIHGNMTAWIGVLDHPYFAVIGPEGKFEFRGLPPGDYVIEAWHEYYGSRRAQVTVGDAPVPPLRFPF